MSAPQFTVTAAADGTLSAASAAAVAELADYYANPESVSAVRAEVAHG